MQRFFIPPSPDIANNTMEKPKKKGLYCFASTWQTTDKTCNEPHSSNTDGQHEYHEADQSDDERFSAMSDAPQHKPTLAQRKPVSNMKKAPEAPKRFKSAFIFFSAEKHKEIRAQMGDQGVGEKVNER